MEINKGPILTGPLKALAPFCSVAESPTMICVLARRATYIICMFYVK